MKITRRGLGGLGLAPLLGAPLLATSGSPAAAQSGVVTTAPMPCLDRSGDIVGLVLEGSGAPSGSIASFGQVFKSGDLPRNAGLEARLADGGGLAVQMDVKTRHADGSVRFAVLALATPALSQGSRAGVILSRAGAASARALNTDAVLARHGLVVVLNDQRIDLLALLRDGLAQGAARRFRSGPLVVESRIEMPMTVGDVTSLRLVADIALRADGEMAADIWLRNDGAMQRGGGTVGYRVQVQLDGQEAMAAEIPRQFQYTAWGRLLHSGRPHALVRPDAAYLTEAGAAPRYDLSTGVAESVLARMAGQIQSPDWAQPLGARGIERQMGRTGARGDIGPMTLSQAAWLQTGDPRAAVHAMGQAEAAGGIPWHFWDTEAGRWMDTRRWPRLWTDDRGGPPPGGLAQRIAGNTGWQTISSHQPDLSYLPWILTGRRAFLDGLQAQACWCVLGQWPAPRGTAGRGLAEGVNVVRNNQVRGAAWSLRTLGNAAWASPDEDETAPWLRQVVRDNWAWVNQKTTGWTRAQGEPHGWIPGEYGEPGLLPPWQQDYFASAAVAAARQGNADAHAVLEWMTNFLAGRFLAEAKGFARHDGVAYLLAMNADANLRGPLRSWKEVGDLMRSRRMTNGTGWSKSGGDYPQLALQALAGLWDVTGSADAGRAYAWLSEAEAPFTDAATYRRDPRLNIVPRGRPRVPGDVVRCR